MSTAKNTASERGDQQHTLAIGATPAPRMLVNSYADTSFLFSLYARDTNSPRAVQLHAANLVPFPFTELHRLEVRNALSLAVFSAAHEGR